MPNPFARCMNVAGSLAAGAILFRLVYWLPKSKIKDPDGRRWVSFTHERWCTETALTNAQYRKAITQLKKAGLINAKTGMVKGKNTSFMTLSKKAHMRLSAHTYAPDSAYELHHTAQIIDTTYLSEIISTEGNIVSSEASLASENPGKPPGSGKVGTMIRLPPKKNRKSVNAGASEAKPTSVLDVAAKVKANKILHKPDSVMALKYLWMNLLSEHHGIVSTVLTAKQLGLLKHFLNKCPPGTAEAAMTVAVTDWIKFVKTVESAMGIKTTPAQPKLEFLLTYAGVAVNLIKQSPKSKPSKQEADTGMISQPNVQLIAKSEEPAKNSPQSLDELLNILGGGD